MECSKDSIQESLLKVTTRCDNDHLQNDDPEMKQGIQKGGGDSEDVENGSGQRHGNTLEIHKTCCEEQEDLDETITNENISDYVMNQSKEEPLNVSCTGGDLKDALNGLDVTKHCFESEMKDSEPLKKQDVNTTDSLCRIESVDLRNVVNLEEGLVICEKEKNMYLFDNDDAEAPHNNGNEAEVNALDMLNITVTENSDFKVVETSSKLVGDGSDSGVEVSGCASYGGRESSLALLRAFNSNSGGYISSCGGPEDSLTASTATPAASCDSSLISCYSTYEETEDIVTSTTTMMLPPDGDGTSEGGSESSSVAGKDVRHSNLKNGSSKRVTPSSVRVSAKTRTPATEVAKSNSSSVSNKVKSASPTATPVNSSRPKATLLHHQTPITSKTLSNVGTAAAIRSSATSTTSHKQEKVPLTMTTSCGTVKSSFQKSSTNGSSAKSSSSLSKCVCGSTVSFTKGHAKEISLSVGQDGRRDAVSVSTPGKGKGTRNSTSIRNKVIGGTDDGRWPSSASKSLSLTSRSRGSIVVDGQPRKLNVSVSSSVVSASSMESKATALEKYATLPRRRKCKSPEIQTTLEKTVRSHSVSRDPSLNRAASLRKQHHQKEGSSLNKSLPPYPRRRYHGRTVIYHETGSQTVLTATDLERAEAGLPVKQSGPLDVVETQHQEVQVDQKIEEVQQLEFQLKLLTEDHNQLKADSVRHMAELISKEKLLEEAKAEKLAVREELDMHSQRILAMLRDAKADHLEENDSVDYLRALETYLQSSSNVVVKQQQEINELQTLCRTLKRDLERSLAAQKTLLQQQQETEAESLELQEFLQAEKSTLGDALRDAEAELSRQKQQVSEKECGLERQQEELKHLVRISEQRRQENLALQAQLCRLEQRSRELLLQQGAAVSGAAVALSGLSSRLDGLIEQLVVSYNISEKDLEDVIFHNEAYSKSNSSVEASPERTHANRLSEQPSSDAQHTPSPKRGATFVSAVISAILNAAIGGAGKQAALKNEGTVQEVQDAHGEVEEDVKDLNKRMEQNREDTCSNPHTSPGSVANTCLVNSESLQNLSRAILNRQQVELEQDDGSCCTDNLIAGDYDGSSVDLLPALEDCSPAITLVDQIIDVDNLLTKLLKVLRIIQLENDTCVDELHDERMQLAEQVRREQESRREIQEEVRNWERVGARLHGQVQDVQLQLQRRIQELKNTKDELQQYRDQTEKLNRELHNLSSVCKQAEQQLHSHEEAAEYALQQWQERGQLPSPEILARLITAHDEVPFLKEKLAEKEQQLHEMGQKYSSNKQVLTENWHQAAAEVRRQYEAIDSALETLHSIQGVVMQCPSLVKLQQDLEETNFHCASSLPVIAADLNANAPPLGSLNGTHSGGTSGLETTHKSGNIINGRA